MAFTPLNHIKRITSLFASNTSSLFTPKPTEEETNQAADTIVSLLGAEDPQEAIFSHLNGEDEANVERKDDTLQQIEILSRSKELKDKNLFRNFLMFNDAGTAIYSTSH